MEKLEKLLAESEGLKGCPFCRKKPEILFDGVEGDTYGMFLVHHEVKDCGLHGFGYYRYKTKEEAISHWNARPGEQKLAEICRVLIEDMNKYLTNAYNTGVAAGMLKDKADHCYYDALKHDYLERMGFYQEEFKGLHKQALARAEEIAGEPYEKR